jgi:transposase
MPKPGPRTTFRYTEDFKATAVRLSQLPGVAVGDVAASLYIHPFMLSRWRKQAREGSPPISRTLTRRPMKADRSVPVEAKKVQCGVQAWCA